MSRRKQYRPIRLPEDDNSEGDDNGDVVDGESSKRNENNLTTETITSSESVVDRSASITKAITLKVAAVPATTAIRTTSDGEIDDDQLIINGNANEYESSEESTLQTDNTNNRPAREATSKSNPIANERTNNFDKNHQLTEDAENNNSNESIDENMTKSPDPGLNHVMLGTLENTKVAVAQFNPVAQQPDKESALKELAMLQTTLFSLQHQQVFQMQLIKQLQLQLAENDEDEMLLNNDQQQHLAHEQNDNDVAQDELIKQNKNKNSEQTSFQTKHIDNNSELNLKEIENQIINLKKETSTPSQSSSRCESPIDELHKMRDYETEINQIKQRTPTHHISPPANVSPVPLRASLCQISSSLASTIITHDSNYPEPNEINSLEMLQRTAQESLDSASSGLLAGNLADELAFRREKSYSDGKNGKGEPFFKHRCRYCGKVFGSDSALQIHLRSHTGERPFKCNVCASKFTTKGNLKVHYQRHTQRFPNIPLGHIPIPPEHMDRYHPALLAKLASQNGALQPHPPHSPLPPPPPGFLSAEPYPGLPRYRPPLELLKTIGQVSGTMPGYPTADGSPTDLRKSDRDDPSNRSDKDDSDSDEFSEKKRKLDYSHNDELHDEHSAMQIQTLSPLNSDDEVSNDSRISEQMNEQPENLSKPPAKDPPIPPRSPSPNERRSKRIMMMAAINRPPPFVTLPPRPRSNDNSWENFIEIKKPSDTETSKLQHLVDNIEHKLTDPNQCLVCHRILSCRSSLQMHYRIHTGERPFRCRLCGRSFTTKGNLKVHMSVHRLLPPMRSQHQCPVCHKKFLNSLVLQQHIRLHTGEHIELTLEQIAAAEIQEYGPPHSDFTFNKKPQSMLSPNIEVGEDDFDMHDDYKSMADEEESQLTDREELREKISEMTSRLVVSEPRAMLEPMQHYSQSNENSMRTPSPATSIASGQALDLTPRLKPTPSSPLRTKSQPSSNLFRNFPIPTNSPIHPANSFLARSFSLPSPQQHDLQHFNPLNLAGIQGTTTCSICFKTFACHSALETHYRSHTKERPFKCSLCSRSFSTKSSGAVERHQCHCSTPEDDDDATAPLLQQKLGNMKQHMQGHKSTASSSPPDANDNSSVSSLDSSPALDENSQNESTINYNSRNVNNSPDVLNLTEKSMKKTNNSDNYEEFKKKDKYGVGDNESRHSTPERGYSPERRTSTSGLIVVDNPTNLNDSSSRISCTNNNISSKPQQLQHHNFNLSPQHQQHQQKQPNDGKQSPPMEMDYDRYLELEQLKQQIKQNQREKQNHKQTENFVFLQKVQQQQHHRHISRLDNNDKQNKQHEHEINESNGEPSPLQILSPMAQLIFSQQQQQQKQQQHQTPLQNILQPQQMEQQHQPNSLSLLSTLAQSSNSYPNGKNDNTNQMNKTTSTTTTINNGSPISPLSSTSSASSSMTSTNKFSQLGNATTPPTAMTPTTSTGTSSPTIFDASNVINTKHLCKVCRKNFSSSSALQIHFRTHTGDKPFRCHVCQKAFTTKGNLKVHMGIHVWTNSASRRGRRMSLELPLNRPLSMVPQEPEFLQRRPDWFYPYIPPPYLNGIPPKIPDIGTTPPTNHNSKFSSLMNFGTSFMSNPNMRALHRPPSPSPSLNSDRSSIEPMSPPPTIIMRSRPTTDASNRSLTLVNVKPTVHDNVDTSSDELNLTVNLVEKEVIA